MSQKKKRKKIIKNIEEGRTRNLHQTVIINRPPAGRPPHTVLPPEWARCMVSWRNFGETSREPEAVSQAVSRPKMTEKTLSTATDCSPPFVGPVGAQSGFANHTRAPFLICVHHTTISICTINMCILSYSRHEYIPLLRLLQYLCIHEDTRILRRQLYHRIVFPRHHSSNMRRQRTFPSDLYVTNQYFEVKHMHHTNVFLLCGTKMLRKRLYLTKMSLSYEDIRATPLLKFCYRFPSTP